MNSKINFERDVRLSKKLSYLLRHGALKEKIDIKSDGFANVEDILVKHLSGYNLDDIKRVVADDCKRRFTLTDKNGFLEIRANQGHSIKKIDRLTLREIENPDFDIIHATYLEHWPKIKNQGLSRMKRNHIHFAKGLNSPYGLRASATLYIYINIEKAKEANLQFFESENGVVLCTGDERGILESKYFAKVVTREGKIIFPES